MQTLVQGWTERIRTQLFADGAPFDLTGYDEPPASVEMLLYNCAKVLVTPSGTSGIDTPATGIVYFDPAPDDLLASMSPYSVRWQVTDSAGKIAFFPNGRPDVWTVQLP